MILFERRESRKSFTPVCMWFVTCSVNLGDDSVYVMEVLRMSSSSC